MAGNVLNRVQNCLYEGILANWRSAVRKPNRTVTIKVNPYWLRKLGGACFFNRFLKKNPKVRFQICILVCSKSVLIYSIHRYSMCKLGRML